MGAGLGIGSRLGAFAGYKCFVVGGSLAAVCGTLHAGKKRLVFCHGHVARGVCCCRERRVGVGSDDSHED